MGKLTDTRLRAMKPNGKVQKASYGTGLYAYRGARSKGISWQMAYHFENRQKVLTHGQYPAVSLAEARRKCLEAQQVLASGRDLGEVREAHGIPGRCVATCACNFFWNPFGSDCNKNFIRSEGP